MREKSGHKAYESCVTSQGCLQEICHLMPIKMGMEWRKLPSRLAWQTQPHPGLCFMYKTGGQLRLLSVHALQIDDLGSNSDAGKAGGAGQSAGR